MVTVRFPSRSLTVEYDRPTGQPRPEGFAADVQQMKGEAAKHPGSGSADLLDLNGVPAMFTTGDYTFGAGGSASIYFIVGETAVTMYGDQDEATLQALAQSILDRMPAPRQIGTADASTVLGAPVVLPETSLVSSSEISPTASSACPSQPTAGIPCQVAVEFPSLTVHYVPLTLRYLRPVPTDPGVSYQDVVRQIKGAEMISLNGEQALFVPGPPGAYPSWLEFVAGGTDVTVQGNYDKTTLQAIAQSILTQSGSQPRLQAAEPGSESFRYPLGRDAKQIPLSDATPTLGAPVTLPDSQLVKASDAGAVWTDAPDSHGTRRIAVTFPSQSLTVKYERPAPYADPLAAYRQVVANSSCPTCTPKRHLIDLSGVPALATDEQSGGSDWEHGGSIQFERGGTDIVIQGHYDESTLQDVAQSIVNRSAL